MVTNGRSAVQRFIIWPWSQVCGCKVDSLRKGFDSTLEYCWGKNYLAVIDRVCKVGENTDLFFRWKVKNKVGYHERFGLGVEVGDLLGSVPREEPDGMSVGICG